MDFPTIPSKTLFLDTETTGLHPPRDKLIEVALVDENGHPVIDTLVNPLCPIGDAKKIHGITDEMVRNAPNLREFWPAIEAVVTGCHVIIYNKDFDTKFFPNRLMAAGHISCCMERFAPAYGEWNEYHGNFRWQKLATAVNFIGYDWEGPPHRALSDALACRAVWNWLKDRDRFNEQATPPGLPAAIQELF
jgi:DNA polymerase III epsilon subunit-like protein